MSRQADSILSLLGKGVVILFCVYVLYALGIGGATWTFLDYANLGIHEGGHLVALPLGEFVHVLSGSFAQLVVPLLFALYFLKTKQYFSSAFCFFWFGESSVNLSFYIADAQTRSLPLLGGEGSIHDWNYLLSRTGLLNSEMAIATSVKVFGFIVMTGGIGVMTTLLITRLASQSNRR